MIRDVCLRYDAYTGPDAGWLYTGPTMWKRWSNWAKTCQGSVFRGLTLRNCYIYVIFSELATAHILAGAYKITSSRQFSPSHDAAKKTLCRLGHEAVAFNTILASGAACTPKLRSIRIQNLRVIDSRPIKTDHLLVRRETVVSPPPGRKTPTSAIHIQTAATKRICCVYILSVQRQWYICWALSKVFWSWGLSSYVRFKVCIQWKRAFVRGEGLMSNTR